MQIVSSPLTFHAKFLLKHFMQIVSREETIKNVKAYFQGKNIQNCCLLTFFTQHAKQGKLNVFTLSIVTDRSEQTNSKDPDPRSDTSESCLLLIQQFSETTAGSKIGLFKMYGKELRCPNMQNTCKYQLSFAFFFKHTVLLLFFQLRDITD